MKKLVPVLVLSLLFGLRFLQAERSFQKQQSVFPRPEKGVFRVVVAEEPQVLFEHAPGSHDTGRAEGFYEPCVKEVRAVCTLVGMLGPGQGRGVPPLKQHQRHPHPVPLPLRERVTRFPSPLTDSTRLTVRGEGRDEGDVSYSNRLSSGASAQGDNDGFIKLPPIKVRCSFRLSPENPSPVLSYGDEVEIDAKIQAPRPALNPGQFDYAHYLKTKGVAYVMYASPGQWRKRGRPEPPSAATGGIRKNAPPGSPSPLRGEGQGEGGSFRPANASALWVGGREGEKYGSFLLGWAYGLKRGSEDILYRYLPFPENALLDGLLLGERSALPEETVQSFFLTGTIHILAVSGMMTAFVAGLFFMVLRALQAPRKAAAALTLAVLLFFVLMTGANPPACRAGLFSALALLAVLLEKRLEGGRLLLTTAGALVLLNPFALEDLSFQISFLATAGLMTLASWMMEKLSFLWRPAAFLVTTTLAAQLAVGCMIIYEFNQVSLYSPFANLLIVPLALASAASGLTLLAGACLHPVLGTLFGAACEVPLKLLSLLAALLSRLPHAEWIAASPPLAWVLAFHALLLVSFFFFWPHPVPEEPSLAWKKRRAIREKGRRLAVKAWAAFLLGSLATATVPEFFGPRPLRAVFLAVGHGNAVVLQSPDGKVLVVDAGREVHGPDRYHPVVAYLRHIGVRKVDAILSTHPDEDHMGGFLNLVSAYPVAAAYEGWGAQSDSDAWKRFQALLRSRGIEPEVLRQGGRLPVLEPGQAAVLHPPQGFAPLRHADNNLSVVSLFSYGGINLVLPGDLEKEGILRLLQGRRPFPRVDWLLAPHHGRASGEPSLCAKALRPRFVVFSDWRDYPKARAAYQAANPPAMVLSTSKAGAVELELFKDGHGRYRTFREDRWREFKAATGGTLTGL